MARHADAETPLRDFYAQGFAERTMARLRNLSPSTVAKRLKQRGLAAPAAPPPRVSTQRLSHRHPEKPALMFDALRALVDCGETERVPCDVAQRGLEALCRQAKLDGTTLSQVVHHAFRALVAATEA
jgi:hypothetical protein